MRSLAFGLVFVAPPSLKKVILRVLCRARIGEGVRIGWFASVSGSKIVLHDYAELRALSVIRCDGPVELGAYSVVSNFNLIYGAGGLKTGSHVYIGPFCVLNVDEDITIGDKSALGPRCMIFTHASFFPYTEGYRVKFAGVTIGSRAWIAPDVIIQPGIRVGDDVYIDAAAMVTRHVQSGDVVRGNPAARVASLQNLKRELTPGQVDDAIREIMRHFSRAVLEKRLGVDPVETAGDRVTFEHRGNRYALVLVPAESPAPPIDGGRAIVLVNDPGWSAPAGLAPFARFDFATMRTPKTGDTIAEELRTFMVRYYGVDFEFEPSA